LYDVAIYIKTASYFQHAVQTVAAFIGITEEDASQMILSPPSVILGSVSKATVDALSRQLGSEVSILYSQPNTAQYHLFLSEDSGATIHRRIIQDLNNAGLELSATSGLVATDVDHATAQKLWQRHQASGLLRIVNQDFLRFDLILQNNKKGDSPNSAQIDVLEQQAGIPVDRIEDVLAAAPITLLESVPHAEVRQNMAVFADVGLEVKATLITFQMLGLEILSLSDQLSTMQVLKHFGQYGDNQVLLRPPFVLPHIMPELQARIIRGALEDSGAEVAFVEES